MSRCPTSCGAGRAPGVGSSVAPSCQARNLSRLSLAPTLTPSHLPACVPTPGRATRQRPLHAFVSTPTSMASIDGGGGDDDDATPPSTSTTPHLPPRPSRLRVALRVAVGTPSASADAIVATEFEFSRAQEAAFVKFEASMLAAASRYAALAAASLLPAVVGGGGGHGHGAGGAWLTAAEGLGCAFVSLSAFAASCAFGFVPSTRGRDLRWLMLGFSDIAAAVSDISVLSIGLALLQVAIAAAAAPSLAAAAAACMTFAGVAARLSLFHSGERGLASALATPRWPNC